MPDSLQTSSPVQPDVKPARRLYIDWLRGVAVLVMVLWHTVDSWHTREARDTLAFGAVQFLAGWAAPLFLFLAGVSMPMGGVAKLARGVDRQRAASELQRRGWEVFAIAHVFRLQSFLLNPSARWNSVFKPDILNVLGLGLVAAAWAWRRADTPKARVWWLLAPVVVIGVLLTPWARTWWWPTLLHPRLEAYIRPVGNQGVFSVFPAVGFLFAGAFVGASLAEGRGRVETAWLATSARIGAVLVVVGALVDAATLPSAVDVWVGPAAVVAWRVGAMLVMLSAAERWLRGRPLGQAHPLMVFGKTSLFVYWVHVELAYGSLSYPLRAAFGLPGALVAYALFTAAMYGLARWWLGRPKGPLVPEYLRPSAARVAHP